MSNELAGKRIAFLVANVGVEQVELTSPWQAVIDAGGEPVLLAPEKEPVQTVRHETEPAAPSIPTMRSAMSWRRTSPRWCCRVASPIPTSCAWYPRRSRS